MLEELLGLFNTLIEMQSYQKKWNIKLDDLLSHSSISNATSNFIRNENTRSSFGKLGYLGKAIYLMEGGNSKDSYCESIWMDSSFHFFTLRIVDHYFDNYNLSVPFDIKKERLALTQILNGTRKREYTSVQEEAAVFLIEEHIKNFKNIPGYTNLLNKIYETMCLVEDKTLSLETRKEKDLELCILCGEMIIRINYYYSNLFSQNTQKAISYLARATRIWDHLGDLNKDLNTNAFNFILEDAKKHFRYNNLDCNDNHSLLTYIRRESSKKFIKEASEELDKGENLLKGKPKKIYKILRTLMIIKYKRDYLLNTLFF